MSLSTRLTWLLLLVGVGVFGWVMFSPAMNSGASLALVNATATEVTAGEALYTKNCLSCHGPKASGQSVGSPGGGKTPTGAYLAPALNGSGHAWHHPPKMLFSVIRNGSPAADSPMRGFKGRLSDDEIRAVMRYIYSLWPTQIKSRYMGGMRH